MLKNLITVILTSVAKIQPVIQNMPLIYAQAVDIVMGRFLDFASFNDIVKVDIFHYFQNCSTISPCYIDIQKNASDMILELFMNNTPIKVLYNGNK